ncbi:PAS domain S-box-containing protein/diguanylate cyclase (GGDEF) domain-containing protein [Micromonospora pattaloongensis]|uniref:PAS domain S-box-containing protein/diguanylate cyclase (GGDEF) domain-containing protein n=1 Tax=Micromonospora pattaloongensis TaxID=405436 RepID=A0A1H3QB36_9ACTN|nr:EAL domain-containing protein [Micromonospora pattaloongensis]SDZ09909.1 PAS domain S-box-containing protein/diguanylate cyclase (GGDEF) domain-containing protein [Micromonospora pattaloongensis]
MTARRRMTVYLAAATAVSAVYYAVPAWQPVTWGLLGLISAAAVLVGLRHNRPRRRAPWLLVAASLLIFTVGDTTYNILTHVVGQVNPFPSPADAFYQLFYGLLLAGLLLLPERGPRGPDRASLLDALVLTGGLGLLSWIFLISPHIEAHHLTPAQRALSISLPLWDVLILAAGAQLVSSARRNPAVLLLAAGGVGLLVSDVLYGLSQLRGAWQIGGPVDLGWTVLYISWGAAALHPSMAALTEPRALRHREAGTLRLLLLALSSLIPPAVLLVESTTGEVRDATVIALLSAVMFLLVLARLTGVIGTHRQAVARERGIRRASTALVWATNVEQVASAIRVALADLLPTGVEYRVALAEDRDGTGPWPPPPARGEVARLVATATLDPALAARLGGFDAAWQCRITLTGRPAGDPHIGTLYVAGPRAALRGLDESVEALAALAALALERIALSQEINRRSSEEYFRTLVHNTADVILILDDDDRIRYGSPSATTVFGPPALTGLPLSEIVHPEDRADATELLALLRAGARDTADADWAVVAAGGRRVEVEASCRDLRGDPTVDGLVITLRDVTERRELERELTHRAFHDSLTGLANRVLFQERMQQAVARARHAGMVAAALFIDIDDFKVVNDTMGHAAGDELLIAVSQRLAGCLRGQDTAARLGGDEFAAVVEDAADPAEVEEVAARVTAAFARPFPLTAGVVNVTASVGVATTAELTEGQDLLRHADLALYVAKGAGKNQWRRYQPALHTAVLDRMQLRTDLDQAVPSGELAVQYQPIVALDTGRLVGLEALVRWHHPARGLLTPAQFIDVAEESGLIVPIGYWVLERAITDAVAWAGELGPDRAPYVTVNVSVRQFRCPGFVDRVLRTLTDAGLPPERLVLEITESLLLRDDDRVWTDLAALRAAGVRLAIDDFGTGYSSLSYLRQVPANLLKLEKSFIDTILVEPDQRSLVEGILRLAHTLGLAIIAEGIEDPAERQVLAEIGCQFGQGYLFAKPMDYDDMIKWTLAPDTTI